MMLHFLIPSNIIWRCIRKKETTHAGYGELFGPVQSFESVSASPHTYFKPMPLPSHFLAEQRWTALVVSKRTKPKYRHIWKATSFYFRDVEKGNWLSMCKRKLISRAQTWRNENNLLITFFLNKYLSKFVCKWNSIMKYRFRDARLIGFFLLKSDLGNGVQTVRKVSTFSPSWVNQNYNLVSFQCKIFVWKVGREMARLPKDHGRG